MVLTAYSLLLTAYLMGEKPVVLKCIYLILIDEV